MPSPRAYRAIAASAMPLERVAGRIIAPIGATPQQMAAALLAEETFSSSAQRALEHIAADDPYTKRVRYLTPDTRVLVFPRSPNPDDSVAAIRELRQLAISPPMLRLFSDDPFPARLPTEFGPPPLPLYSSPRSRRYVEEAMARQGRYRPQLLAGVTRGMLLGADQWYGTRPLQSLLDISDIGGWGRDLAITTHQRNPASNMRAASHIRMTMDDPEFVRMVLSLPWDTPEARKASARALSEKFRYPQGVGGKAALSDFDAAAAHVLGRDILDYSIWGPMKRTMFGRSVGGDYGGNVGDSHEFAARGIPERGVPKRSEDGTEWGKQMGSDSENEAMQVLAARLAQETGLYPGEIQPARWIGDADLTGVRRSDTVLYGPSVPPSALHTLEDRIFRMGGVPETPSAMKRARSLLRRTLTGGGLLGSLLAPVAEEEGSNER